MTRNDFELIARAVKRGAQDASESQTNALSPAALAHLKIAAAVADALAAQNVRFNRARFLTACGVAA